MSEDYSSNLWQTNALVGILNISDLHNFHNITIKFERLGFIVIVMKYSYFSVDFYHKYHDWEII